MPRVYVRAAGSHGCMSDEALETYLNDHLAGSRLGTDLAGQIRDRSEGTPLHETMTWVATEIEEDREQLTQLMERVGASKNQVKQITAWVGEKASRLKLSELGGLLGGDEEYGLFMSLETLKLGVAGKLGLWEALARVASEHDGLEPAELETLADRARKQLDALEQARLGAASRALANDA
jgi:hypothetical protein